MELLTVGHGTLDPDGFAARLRTAGVARLVDIRRFPGSRRHPHLGRDAMAAWLPEAGVAYEWCEDLGGRRKVRPDSPHVALRNDSFRGYADHMETEVFTAALANLLVAAEREPTAIMCSESVWWRCHRRLVADHATLVEGIDVVHLMHAGRRTPHGVTDGARPDGARVVYDVGVTPPLLGGGG